jgi:hypothetical protein
MTAQSNLALLLLQQFRLRAIAEGHSQRYLLLDLMRSIRQRQAEREFEDMEKSGTKLESSIDWKGIPF